MKIDIINKLRREIESGITKESQVVYLLAGVRKVLEQLEFPEEFRHLKFYCDWVLHTRLTGPPAQEVVKILALIYQSMIKNEQVSASS